eukprot:6086182-Amphidinium_carterae.2
MELDTWRDILRISREFHSSTLLMPMRAPEDNVGKVLRFFLTAHTQFAHMKGAVSAHFMPDASQRGIERTTEAVLSSVSAALHVSKALCA